MLIDAHQHFWRVGENGFVWPTPELPAIYRNFDPTDLKSAACDCGLTGSVLIQSQASSQDTDWLLNSAAAEPLVLAVVGWADLASPQAPARIAGLASNPKLRGLRPMLQDIEDDSWISNPVLVPAIRTMVSHRLSLDALVYGRHLPHLLRLAQMHPDLSIVIDHGAKPPVASGDDEIWYQGIDALAALPQIYCKLSGLLTEMSPRQDASSIRPYMSHLISRFGAHRLMWGSDWPVLNLVSDYRAWLSIAKDVAALLESGDQHKLFGETARRFYRI